MKLKKDMMRELDEKRRKSGFIKKSYWVYKDFEQEISEKLAYTLETYHKDVKLPNNKKSN